MSKTVYLITSGSYSDYRVVCAFSTREKAEKWVNGISSYEIEEYDLDVDEPPLEAVSRGSISLNSGDVKYCRVILGDYSDLKRLTVSQAYGEAVLSLDVVGNDRERLTKVLAEKRAQFLVKWALSDDPFDLDGVYDRETLEYVPRSNHYHADTVGHSTRHRTGH